MISQSRKIFKLFKFINEIPRLIFLIETPMNNFTKNFNFLVRFFHLLFYVLENLTILTSLKFLDTNFRTHIEISMSLCWILGINFHMSYYAWVLKKTYNDEEDLRQLDIEKEYVKDVYGKLANLSKIRFFLLLGLVRYFGDLLMSCYDLKLFSNFLGTKTMRFVVGLFGFLSANISLYQMFFSSDMLK